MTGGVTEHGIEVSSRQMSLRPEIHYDKIPRGVLASIGSNAED